MITKSIEPVWKSVVGRDVLRFATLEEAKKHELKTLLLERGFADSDNCDQLADKMLKHADAFVDVLTTTPTSRPSARKINRAKPRAKKSPTPASVEDALKYQSGLANDREIQSEIVASDDRAGVKGCV